MKPQTQVAVLVALLLTVGIGLTLYKCYALGFTLFPDQMSTVWQVQARMQFDAEGGPVEVSLILPGPEEYRKTLVQEKVADDYVCVFTDDGKVHRAVWTRDDAYGPQVIYYRGDFFQTSYPSMQVPPTRETPEDILAGPKRSSALEIIQSARETANDSLNFVLNVLAITADKTNNPPVRVLLENVRYRREHMEQVQKLLAIEGIHAKVVRGLWLKGRYTQRSITTFIQVYLDNEWHILDQKSLSLIPESEALLWPEGTRGLLDVFGGENSRLDITVSSTQKKTGRLAVDAGLREAHKLLDFSIYSLPLKDQNTFRLLLMIPLGALVVVVLRNIVGIRTSGTFMPILISLTFMQTTLLLGLLLFLVVVGVGLALRIYLSHLNLLLVPRIAAILVFVIIIFGNIGIWSHRFGWESGLMITFFPMIILSWTIERMSILWEESGPKEVLIQGAGSLVTATLAYAVMKNDFLDHLIFNFPELLLVQLAVIILIGSYSGFRLVELLRFEPMTREK